MKKQIPKLRFLEFSENWSFKKLNSIKSEERKVIKAGPFGSAMKKEYYVEKGYKVYGQEQVISEDAFFGDYYIDEETYSKLKSCNVKPNDLLVSLVGTFGKVLLIPEGAEAGIINPRLLRLSIPIELIIPQFSKQYFKTDTVKKKLLSWSQGGTMGVLNAEIVGRLNLPIPQLKEQQKIASFLTAVDKKISKLQQKQTLLEQYKKGVMQKIFSQELRFKEDDGNEFSDWENKKLGEIGEIITGKTPSTSNKELWDGDIQFITPTDINENNKYQFNTQRTVVETEKMKVLPKKSIIYTCIASIGKMALTIEPSVTNQQINTLVPNTDMENEYLYYALLEMTPRIKSTQANTTLPIINKTDFSKFKISIPSIEEQTKIANFLSAIDNKIQLVITQIENTQQFKKGLLQQLFV